MARMPLDADVIVVGGAVAGLAAANAFGAAGASTLVLEKGPERDNSTRGDILHPPTLRFLSRWGVLDALHADGSLPITHIAVSHRDLGRLATYDVPPQGEGPAGRSIAVPHDRIEAVMKDVAATWPRVQMMHAMVLDLERDGTGRVIGARARVGEHEEVYRASVVVGADGISSMVRRRLGIAAPRHPYSHEIIYVPVQGRPDPPRAMHFHLSDRVMLVASRPGGAIRIGVRLGPAERRELLSRPDPALYDFVMARAPYLDTDRFVADDGHVYPLAMQVAERFAALGAALIGDAAHSTHPTGATGMSLAITGASRLADLLAPVLAAHPHSSARDSAVDLALEAFDAERRIAAAAAVAENHRQALRIWEAGVERDPYAFALAANPVSGWGVGGAGWGQDPAALGVGR